MDRVCHVWREFTLASSLFSFFPYSDGEEALAQIAQKDWKVSITRDSQESPENGARQLAVGESA